MGRRGDTYSSVIAWLKLLLPMVALALLSTLFLLPRTTDAVKVPYADNATGDSAAEGVTAPHYAGTTARGDSLIMTAKSARPVEGAEGDLDAQTFVARLDLADGSRLTLASDRALLHDADKSALLEGKVEIDSSTGYVLRTESMRTAIDRIEAETLAPVSGSGPAGEFSAGKLTILPQGDSGDVQLLFTGGVKLLYDPKKQ